MSEAVGPPDWGAAAALASEITNLGDVAPQVVPRATALADRVQARQFHVVVAGEFKRGKSSLVNALLGTSVLPTGTVPLTSVATEVRTGSSSRTTVRYVDGRDQDVPLGDVVRYATERGNPSNHLGVLSVQVWLESDALAVPGFVVVDTPGLGSFNEENSLEARRALERADAVIVVLSVESPISGGEQELLQSLGSWGGKVFVVVNKIDHLSADELDELMGFLRPTVDRALGRDEPVFPLSARPTGTTSVSRGSEGLVRFRDHLRAYLSEDLDGTRYAAVVAELRRLGDILCTTATLTTAAMALDRGKLEDRRATFEAIVETEHRRLREDRLVLEADVTHLVAEAVESLSRSATSAALARTGVLEDAARSVPILSLGQELRETVQSIVEETFLPAWVAFEATCDTAWGEAAARFTDRAEQRVAELRREAGDAFDAVLPPLIADSVHSLPSHFSFHFVHTEGPTASVGRLSLGLLPRRLVRERAFGRARRQLVASVDRHVGRARHDLDQRVRTVAGSLASSQTAAFEELHRAVEDAVVSVRGHLVRSLQMGSELSERTSRALEIAALIGRLAEGSGTTD